MSYRVEIVPAASRELADLPNKDRKRAVARIRALADDPRPRGIKMLQGRKSYYRFRVGRYRVIYEVRDAVLVVLVVAIGHRREVYRRP